MAVRKVLETEFRARDAGLTATLKAAAQEAERTSDKVAKINAKGAMSDAAGKRAVDAIKKWEAEATQTKAEALATRLRMEGRSLDAELLLLEAHAQKQKAIVQEQLQAKLKTTPEADAGRLRSAAAARVGAIDEATHARKASLRDAALKDEQKAAQDHAEMVAGVQGEADELVEKKRAKKHQAAIKAAEEGEKKADGGTAKKKGVLAKLKSGLGKRSALGQIGMLAAGGGGVAALTLIADEIGRAAEKAKGLKEQYDAGNISAAQMSIELAKSLPVLGNIMNAGHSVRSFLGSFDTLRNSGVGKWMGLDEQHEAEKTNKQEEVRKVLLDYQLENIKNQVKATKELAATVRTNNQRMVKAGLDGGLTEEVSDRRTAAANRMQRLRDQRQDELGKAEERRAAAAAKYVGNDSQEAKDAKYKLVETLHRDQADINRRFDQEEASERDATRAEEFRAEREHSKKTADVMREGGDDLAATVRQIGAARLRENKQTPGAELKQIEDNAAEQKQAIERSLKDQLKQANTLEGLGLKALAALRMKAKDILAGIETHTAVRETLDDAKLQALRAQADAGDKLAAVTLRMAEADKELAEKEVKLQAILNSGTASDKDKADARNSLGQLKGARGVGIDHGLHEEDEQLLEDEANNGRTPKQRRDAKGRLEEMRLQDKFEQWQAEAMGTLNDPKASPEQKKRTLDNLGGFADRLSDEYDKEMTVKEDRKSKFELQDRGLLMTGVSAAAGNHDPQHEMLRKTDKSNELLGEMHEAIDKMATALTRIGPTPPPMMPVFGPT